MQDGIKEKEFDYFSNPALITIINTTVQAELKETSSDDSHSDDYKKNLIIDVNVHKSFEELVIESPNEQMKEMYLREVKTENQPDKLVHVEENNKSNSENLNEKIKFIVPDNVKLNSQSNDMKKSASKKNKKNFLTNMFSKIQSKKIKNKKSSNANLITELKSNQEKNEISPKSNDNNPVRADEVPICNQEREQFLDSEQTLRIKKMRNKVIEIISDKLKSNNLIEEENENTVKTLLSRSIDLIRNYKVQSFTQLDNILKKEFASAKAESTIDKLVNSLEVFFKEEFILKNVEIEEEKYEEIIFPCDYNKSDAYSLQQKSKSETNQVQVTDILSSINETKEILPNNEINVKSLTNSSKFTWALGLDSLPNSSAGRTYANENSYMSPIVKALENNQIYSGKFLMLYSTIP